MKEVSGSDNLPEKNRRPFGCLIIKKKPESVSGGGSRKSFEGKERKRRLILSDSEESDDGLLSSSRRNLVSSNSGGGGSNVGKINVYNSFEREDEIDRKRSWLVEDSRIGKNRIGEVGNERKRSRVDGFEDDERGKKIVKKERLGERGSGIERNGSANAFFSSESPLPSGNYREFDSGHDRSAPLFRREHSDFDRSKRFPVDAKREMDYMDKHRIGMKEGTFRSVDHPRDKYGVSHGEQIRVPVPCKNGVLKVMINNRNKVGGPEKLYARREEGDNRNFSRIADISNWKSSHSPSFYSDDKTYQSRSVAVGEKNHKKSREKLRSVAVDEKNHLSPFKNFSAKERDNRKQVNDMFLRQESKDVSGSMEVKKKRDSRTEVNDVSLPHELKEVGSSREVKRERDNREEVSDTSSPQESKDVSSSKEVKKKAKKLKAEPHLLTVRKEGEVRRGFGTEKQLLREQIRKIILDAGWTIDFRPRRGRNYQDAVYKSPSGTEYWSIVKAYNALQKNFEDEGSEDKNNADASFFTPIPEEVLKKLTRQTKKKMEREMKMKNKADGGSRNAKETSIKQGKNKHAKLNMGSSVVGKKTNLYASHDAKSFKARATGSSIRPNTNDLKVSRKSAVPVEKADNEDGESPVDESSGASLKRLQKANGDKMVCFASDANSLEGGKRKHHPGRALLVRGSNCGKNLDGDDFVPYTGKRTVLSWLVDMETVRMSEKVQYMNKKRTKAMLEGWVTRDGIHCGCCSKILSVSKFEIHAASKLRQPFQNIFVEGGFSLLKCQLNAWDKLAKYIRDGFYSIHVDDDDPNDDTCGICGDGGDLICCDSCPSTFHQSCLAIQMLPPGDWHCPNCSCKYCNGVDGNIGQGEDTLSPLSTCSMCEEKYHQVCTLHSDSTPTNSNGSCTSFCGQMCKELFQHLQKLLGVKHELKDGFSWTLIQRSDLNFESSSRGLPQKTECNSKLAVALAVMNECFLPVIDRRSGINLIQNVLFNIGSNFSRLNYSGFYTAILERGDEIIAAASIRIHGTRLAEMPYIGTRHIYRRQGMCRRLLNAIERALCSVNVEKLVIPAISELTNTWTTVFGFKPLEERQRQGMRNLNMLVFPSTDMLQKPLLKHKLNEGDLSSGSDAQAIELKNNSDTVLVLANHCDKASLVEPGVLTRDQEVKHTSETNTGSDSLTNGLLGISSSEYDTSNVISNPLDGGGKPLPHAPREVSAPGSKFLHRTEECGTKLEDVMEKMSDSFFGPKYLTEDASNVFSIVMDVEDPYASKTKQERASVNTDLRSSGGSTYDTSNEISNPLDASSGSVHHAFREKSAIDTKVDCDIKLELDTEPISKLFVKESTPATKILDRGIDYAAKLELDTKPISDSSIERKYGREDAKHHDLKLNLSVAIELDLHSSAETSMECMTNTGGDYKNAEFGSSRHPTVGNPVRNDLDLNKVKVEKESVPVFHAVSDATLDENILMASKESTEQDFCQVRFQDLAPAHDPFTSDEIRTYRSSSVNTQQQDVECMDGFLGSGRNVSSHDSECTNQSFNTVSEYNDQGSSERTLPPHHDSHLSKDTQECASDATDTIANACGVENEVAAVEHMSRSFQDSVDCTSEVIGSSMSLSTGCVEM